jgi:polyhydroxyalkanoate synthase subunit PhaC
MMAPRMMEDEVEASAGYLDLLLSDAALGTLRRFLPGRPATRLGLGLARRPGAVARRTASLATGLGAVAAGRSPIAPDRRDRRFADPAWTGNPLLRRAMQAYLAVSAYSEALVADAGLDENDAERVRFLLMNAVEALAPSNNPLLSPVAWKALIDTGGLSAVRGLRAFARDMATAPRVPSMVKPDAFEVGRDLAVTPGAVVARTDLCELIQYAATADRVHRFPLVVVPPMINKYYITDLAPGRSLIEYLASQGHQVFAISWRNPDARHRDWGLDAYGAAIDQALETARRICDAERASICALCSGGIVSSMVAAVRPDQLASLFLGVTVLDNGPVLVSERTLQLAVAASRARGYLDGRTLAEVFAWLRPGDLIWNYWVNNYLQGRPPAPFDILYWNADTTRMPAALHADFIRLFTSAALPKPGAATMLGSPVDLSAVRTDTYVVAGIADHLCRWESCYASARLLGGDVRFALSTSGHIASMVNPPANPKARFQVAPAQGDADEWLAHAQSVTGSWWPDYSAWLAERGGGQRAPVRLPDRADPAPGRYVLDR